MAVEGGGAGTTMVGSVGLGDAVTLRGELGRGEPSGCEAAIVVERGVVLVAFEGDKSALGEVEDAGVGCAAWMLSVGNSCFGFGEGGGELEGERFLELFRRAMPTSASGLGLARPVSGASAESE